MLQLPFLSPVYLYCSPSLLLPKLVCIFWIVSCTRLCIIVYYSSSNKLDILEFNPFSYGVKSLASCFGKTVKKRFAIRAFKKFQQKYWSKLMWINYSFRGMFWGRDNIPCRRSSCFGNLCQKYVIVLSSTSNFRGNIFTAKTFFFVSLTYIFTTRKNFFGADLQITNQKSSKMEKSKFLNLFFELSQENCISTLSPTAFKLPFLWFKKKWSPTARLLPSVPLKQQKASRFKLFHGRENFN